ncbi:MAG: hypothetical protein M3Y59_25475 [Myxococcota bacterium]|nr:hypothetical protein [Myxococcota bacterium]
MPRPPPTSIAYSACALDADCPRGDHCALGACTHQCISDRDCTNGEVCSNRGRCAAPEQVSQPPEIVATSTGPGAARLAVSTGTLRYERGQLTQQLTLSNEGGEPLTFRALSSRSWISISPAQGEISGQPVTVVATVDPAQVGAEEVARVRFNSTGGAADVDVLLPRNLSGLYSGNVQFTTPYPFAVSSLHLSFTEGGTGALTGLVDPERSLLYPFRAQVSGTVTGNDLNLQFNLVGLPSSALNPSFTTPVRRTVTLTGSVTGAGVLEGTVTELIEGAVADHPLILTGTFRLERVGEPLAELPASAAQYSPPIVASPFTGAAYQACLDECPVVGGCDDDLEAGTTYLTRAADFYSQFASAAAASGSPFLEVATNCSTTGCLNAVNLRCAQYRFARSVVASPKSGSSAETGLMDTLATLGDYSMLFGGNEVVRAVEAWKTQTLSAEVGVWDAAIGYFKVARQDPGAGVRLRPLRNPEDHCGWGPSHRSAERGLVLRLRQPLPAQGRGGPQRPLQPRLRSGR